MLPRIGAHNQAGHGSSSDRQILDPRVMSSSTDSVPARRVSYIHSGSLIRAADRLPSNEGRASIVHNLTHHLDLLHHNNGRPNDDHLARATVVESIPATREELTRFHDPAFVGQSRPHETQPGPSVHLRRDFLTDKP